MKTLTTIVAVVTFFTWGPALAHGRLADISVYDRAEGRWLQVYRHEGRAYVVGKPGHEYHVRVANRLREDLLAVVSVDGVNVISGQTAHPSQSGYVLSPRGSLDIRGWRKSLAETAAFYFTALPDSYAARTGGPDDVGVIGVALFRRKSEPKPIAPIAPEAASGARRAEERADSRLGTGHGGHDQRHGRDSHALLRQPREPGRPRHHSRADPGRADAAAVPRLCSRPQGVNSP
jgi:hypothetical protein